jgi:acetyl-CoA carboxylase carboxyl transferase subunit alpha
MKMTAEDLKMLRVIDRIVVEPMGGAHRDHAMASAALAKAVEEELQALSGFSSKELQQQRRAKFLAMGA